jgi:hypothetical protein
MRTTTPACAGDARYVRESAELSGDDLAAMRERCGGCPLLLARVGFAHVQRPSGGFWAGRFYPEGSRPAPDTAAGGAPGDRDVSGTPADVSDTPPDHRNALTAAHSSGGDRARVHRPDGHERERINTMTTTETANPAASAYRAFREALVSAPTYTDPRLTGTANGEERAKLIRSARAALAAAIPEVPQRTVTRADVFAARAPKTADDVAIQGREREKIMELRQAGQSFAQIIGNASEVRVAALIDVVEGIAAAEPAQSAELSELLYDRLVALGAQDAVTAAAEDQATTATTAWHDALTEASEVGEVSVRNRTAVYLADPDGYSQAFSAGDTPVDWATVTRIESAHTEVTA